MHNKFMQEAIKEAQKAGEDIPVGAIIVKNGQIIARAHNEREKMNDVLAHAEILALKRAASHLNSWRLNDCALYVTLEPCPMCAWAILQSRISEVYFGAYDSLYGAFVSALNLREKAGGNLKVLGGIMEEECNIIIKNYFKELRK